MKDLLLSQPDDPDSLRSRSRAAGDLDASGRNIEAGGEESAKGLIRPAFYRRGAQANTQDVILPAGDGVVAGAGYHAYGENDGRLGHAGIVQPEAII